MKKLTNEVIEQKIDLGLSTLGENGKHALWFYLESQSFNSKNAPENLEGFVQALKNFFGIGYTFLDEIFRQKLNQTMQIDINEYSSFIECINHLKNHE